MPSKTVKLAAGQVEKQYSLRPEMCASMPEGGIWMFMKFLWRKIPNSKTKPNMPKNNS